MSSVYLWDIDADAGQAGGFGGCFLIHKESDSGKRGLLQAGGYWDAIHVVEAREDPKTKSATYQLTSSVMLYLQTSLSNTTNSGANGLKMAGGLTRQEQQTHPMTDGHLVNIGRMIEEMESKLRSSLDQVYFGKTRQVVEALRTSPEFVAVPADREAIKKVAQNNIMAEVMQRRAAGAGLKASNNKTDEAKKEGEEEKK